MVSSPMRRASCPSQWLSLVCKIPMPLFGLSETNTIGSYTEPLSIRILRDVRGCAITKSLHDLLLASVVHRERHVCHVFASSMPQTFTSIVPSVDSAPSPQTSARCFSRQPSRPIGINWLRVLMNGVTP